MSEIKKSRENKMKNPTVILVIVFLVLGVVFVYIQIKDNKNYDKKVNATVKRVDSKYDSEDSKYKYKAYCEYVVGGKIYNYKTSWITHKYKENDEIEISINSDNPGKVNRHLFAIIAGACLSLSLMLFILHIKKVI